VFCLIDFAIYTVCMYPTPVSFDWKDFGYNLIYGMSLFFGWSCLFLALLYSFEVRDGERRLAAAREEALSAQMQALRYQVNPHFLFNTLNSMAGLIEEGSSGSAREMVLRLSAFLRTTLALDPMQDVRLEDEIALQSGYLDIERNRFSDRMIVKIDIAPELHNALVPSLILQPLVENAVKQGVGRTPGQVEISISTTSDDEYLSLVVENDMLPDDMGEGPDAVGMGIGL
ncbi:sensor histidine kinase, partial [Rhizobiaceae sp. 2RAB30]